MLVKSNESRVWGYHDSNVDGNTGLKVVW